MVKQDGQKMISGIIPVPRNEAILLLEAGYLLIQMGNNKDALAIFNGVADLLPESDAPLVALGNLFFGQGKFDEAIREYKLALEKNAACALAQASIGETLLFQQKFDEGIAALKKSVDMDPRGPVAKFAKELLKAQKDHFFDKPIKLKK